VFDLLLRETIMKSLGYLSLFISFAMPIPALSEDINGFDPSRSCVEVLSNTGGTTDQFMIASWVFGYLAAQDDTLRPVSIDNNKVVLQNLTKACIDSGGASLIDLVAGDKGRAKPAKGADAGSEAAARALLSQFLDPGSDRYALTQAILPRPEDIRAVYGEPLASNMIATYEKHLTANVAISPKEGQTQLLMWYASTDGLKRGSEMLREFPGGYGDVRGYFQGDHPIVRFKFVSPGEKLGMAYDGLIHVNGRWVWMPKPWRSLDN